MKCMFANLYEHVDLSHDVLKVFESRNLPGFYPCCFQRGNLHQPAHPGYHLDTVVEGIEETMRE